uniref:Uncharacterized protein n=1 Tax=Siphoviridae sp. ctXOZ1 TaxID=2823585 RepID=A0A8S5LBC8_9CAUD|nr:MAG TPA: hypothetical protein [Siphoviridae sp. ctXOZ1]
MHALSLALARLLLVSRRPRSLSRCFASTLAAC